MHEPHDPVMQRWRHPKEPRTLTGTSTVTSCLHFPGLVTVWACLTHPLWLGSTSALPEATTVLFRSTHTLLGHSKTPAGLPPSCCDAGMPVRRTTQFCLGGGGKDTAPASASHFPAVPLAVQRRPLRLGATSRESASKALHAACGGPPCSPKALGDQRPAPVEHGSLMQDTPTSTPQVARLVATCSPEATTLCRAPSHTEPQRPHR